MMITANAGDSDDSDDSGESDGESVEDNHDFFAGTQESLLQPSQPVYKGSPQSQSSSRANKVFSYMMNLCQILPSCCWSSKLLLLA
jgi:hypothetical protein